MRIGNELGAGHPKSASFAVVIVTSSSFIISVVCAIVVLALRHVISYAFTEGETVSDAVSDLSPYLAVSIILNGIQPVLSGTSQLYVYSTLFNFLLFLLMHEASSSYIYSASHT